jgi:hypothetical protein
MRTMARLGLVGQDRRGSALVMVTMAAAVLATLSFSILAVSLAGSKEQRGAKERIRARYVCEAGLADAVYDMADGGTGDLGSKQNPVKYGNGNYWVDTTNVGGELYQMVATGREARAGARLELTLQRTTHNVFEWGAFGDEFLVMDSNARTDSYVSTLGTYASQAINGSGSNLYAKKNGDVGSNGDITLMQNVKVWGDALPGPGESTTIVGTNVSVSGGTAPQTEMMELKEIDVPLITSSGPQNITGTTTVIAAGDHRWTDFTVQKDAKVMIMGPARLVFDNFHLKANSQFIVDATAGPVEMYVNDDFILDSNTLVSSTTQKPVDINVNLLSDNVINPDIKVQLDIITFDSNAKMFGTIYAPSAVIDIDSNFELFGSLVARRVSLDSNARIHYDESLATAASLSEYTFATVCWRVLPYGS